MMLGMVFGAVSFVQTLYHNSQYDKVSFGNYDLCQQKALAELADNRVAQMPSLQLPATLVVAGGIAFKAIDKISGDDLSIIWLILTMGIFVVMAWGTAKAQGLANIASHDPAGSQNSQFTPANYVWIVLGGLLWIAVIVGFLLPE